jgi:PIN domain nuclease of toxin-antitoxin system
MNKVLFDASALLILINKEKGNEIAEKCLGNIIISSVNHSEVCSKLMDYGMSDIECADIIDSLVSKVIDFDIELSLMAAKLKNYTKQKGLSLGDRACIATGIKYNLEIYTADKAWIECKILDAKIKLVR